MDGKDQIDVKADVEFDYGGDGQGRELLSAKYQISGTYDKKLGKVSFSPTMWKSKQPKVRPHFG